MKPVKQKKCVQCKYMFTPSNSLVKVCGMACALDYGKSVVKIKKVKAEKEFKKETAAMKKAMNDVDKSLWSDKAQKACNKFILERDKGRPCISCGNMNDVKYDAGHYISRGHSAALRFNEFNIHRQCSAYCNSANSGQSIRYRQALVKLYGEEKVLWLEGHHEMPRYRVEDYKRIHEEFTNKLKELKNVSH